MKHISVVEEVPQVAASSLSSSDNVASRLVGVLSSSLLEYNVYSEQGENDGAQFGSDPRSGAANITNTSV
jgi:hypothetical protein